mgnify:CR=1 FL=1
MAVSGARPRGLPSRDGGLDTRGCPVAHGQSLAGGTRRRGCRVTRPRGCVARDTTSAHALSPGGRRRAHLSVVVVRRCAAACRRRLFESARQDQHAARLGQSGRLRLHGLAVARGHRCHGLRQTGPGLRRCAACLARSATRGGHSASCADTVRPAYARHHRGAEPRRTPTHRRCAVGRAARHGHHASRCNLRAAYRPGRRAGDGNPCGF